MSAVRESEPTSSAKSGFSVLPGTQRPGATHPSRAGARRFALLAGALLLGAWPIALSTFRHANVYRVMGPFAIAVIAIVALFAAAARATLVDRRHLPRDVGLGVACGVAMTLLTYLAYGVGVRLIPSLGPHVASLYAASRGEQPGEALGWTAVIIVAEEMLWRSWLLEPLTTRMGRYGALAISLATYAAAQLGSGSGIVALAALVCGSIWLAERVWTGSIVAPLVSHMIWTPIVIHLLPLTRMQTG